MPEPKKPLIHTPVLLVAAGFSVLDDVGDYDVGAGAVICQTREAYPLTADVEAVPVWSI